MGAGRQIIQGHLTNSCCKRGTARDAEGRDHCVGGGQLRLHTDSSSELWIAVSKGPPVSQVRVPWGCTGPCVWREPACHSPEPTESIQCFRLSPSSLDQEPPGAISPPLFLCTPEVAASQDKSCKGLLKVADLCSSPAGPNRISRRPCAPRQSGPDLGTPI